MHSASNWQRMDVVRQQRRGIQERREELLTSIEREFGSCLEYLRKKPLTHFLVLSMLYTAAWIVQAKRPFTGWEATATAAGSGFLLTQWGPFSMEPNDPPDEFVDAMLRVLITVVGGAWLHTGWYLTNESDTDHLPPEDFMSIMHALERRVEGYLLQARPRWNQPDIIKHLYPDSLRIKDVLENRGSNVPLGSFALEAGRFLLEAVQSESEWVVLLTPWGMRDTRADGTPAIVLRSHTFMPPKLPLQPIIRAIPRGWHPDPNGIVIGMADLLPLVVTAPVAPIMVSSHSNSVADPVPARRAAQRRLFSTL